MSVDAKLLARALRAAAAVLDGGATSEPAHEVTTTRPAKEAFEARTDRKTCETCGGRIQAGARVMWGRAKGEMVHERCAGNREASAQATPQALASQPASEPPQPADDFGAGDGEEIPF